MKTSPAMLFAGIPALILCAMLPATVHAADMESCQTKSQAADYPAIVKELDDQLLTSDELTKDRVFSLRTCKVEILIDAGKTTEAAEELSRLRTDTADAPQFAVALRLLTAEMAARDGRFNEARAALAEAKEFAKTQEELENIARATGQLVTSELPHSAKNANALLQATRSIADTPPLSPKTAASLRLLSGRVAAALGNMAEAGDHIEKTAKILGDHPGEFRGESLVALGDAYEAAGLAEAPVWYRAALDAGNKSGDAFLISLSTGKLGALHEKAGQLPAALQKTRSALFFAQIARDEELIFEWQWQSARILRRMDQLDNAVVMNRLAVETLQKIRSERSADDPDFFRKTVRPAYLDLANLLLAKAATKEPEEKNQLLRDTIAAIEMLRADELKDYLRLPCLPVARINLLEHNAALQDATIIYLIDFDDRIGIIAKHGDTLVHRESPVPTRQVKAEAFLLTDSIAKIDENYRESAKRLYQWLIAPLEPVIRKTDILIIVPDGATRAIPFPALLDGEKYLVEKYAVVMNQGLSITDTSEKPSYGNKRFFLGGISEAVAEFNAIPHVASELQAIKGMHSSDLLQDQQFTISQINQELQHRPYPVVHLASHGQFSGNVSESFILTWNGKLNIQELSSIVKSGEERHEPVELISLSACSTAAGDDRAALGLAGVVLKAGAKSAIASLWNVDDEATGKFFVHLYDILQSEPGISKAEAVHKTQLKYLSGEISAAVTDPSQTKQPARDFAHPFFWAPFVLTGNWH